MAIPPITVYREARGVVAQRGEDFFLLADVTLDALFQQDDPAAWLYAKLPHGQPIAAPGDVARAH